MDVCTGVDEEEDEIEVAASCCGVEEGAGCWGVRESVWVLSVGEKESEDVWVVVEDGEEGGERDVVHLSVVRVHAVSTVRHGIGDRGTSVEEELGCLEVAAIGTVHQGRVPGGAADIYPGVSLVEEDGGDGRVARVRGNQDGRLGSAPSCRRTRTVSSWPWRTATLRGVESLCCPTHSFTSAPHWTRIRSTSVLFPVSAAMYSADMFSLLLVLTYRSGGHDVQSDVHDGVGGGSGDWGPPISGDCGCDCDEG